MFAHDGDHTYVNGICTIDGCTDKYEAPALVDGWYQVTNAGQVEWISDYVDGQHSGTIYPKVKLMNDIDFTGVSHMPIGRSSARKFNGIIDGQGHRIIKMVVNLNQECVGLVGWARGPLSDGGNNTTIQNLIIDKTCSFTGTGRVAAFIGRGEVSNNSNSIVYIINCVNEANVTATAGTCGAFVGTHNANDNSPRIWIKNCANHGDITAGSSDKAGAFIGYYINNGRDGGNSTIENSYNTGVVSPKDGGNVLFRGSYRTITNTYDLTNAENTQGNPFRGINEWSTTNPVTSGELAYYINEQAGETVFYQTIGTDEYPVPFSDGHEQVYAHGTYRCDGEALGGITYDNTDGGNPIPPHNFSNGICQNDGCTKRFQAPEVDGEGWTLLANAGNVEWFGQQVNGSYVAKAKLTADIDFENIENLHSPIGPSTGSKFKGEFDGQGHKIKNMIINLPSAADGVGFFGWLQGNATTTIRNLILDSSCSITGNNKVGALAGASQNEGGMITIENVVNEASVTGSGQDVAAIVGGESGNKATFYVHNVVNTGTITSTHADPYAGALFCFQERGIVENFINLGTIVGHNGGNIGRFSGSWKNVVDLSDTEDKTQSVVAELVKADIASGKLAYYMNSHADGGVAFYQTIGTDPYPVPFSTSAQVYAHGSFRCDGEAIGELTYDNENTGDVIPPHNYSADGFCQNDGCTKPFQAPEVDGEGWTLLTNPGNVEWLSEKVESDGGTYEAKAKLTADIDFGGTENLHQPIGRREGAKFKGVFDGQGHRIIGMVINRPSDEFQGFFGYLQGNNPGTTIRNLIIDKSCSVTAQNKAGGVAGASQNGGNWITFENIVNEADVTVSGTDAGGLIGGEKGGVSKFKVTNFVNTGDITSAASGGAVFCWQNSGNIENVVNLGTITHTNGEQGHGNMGYCGGEWKNAVDLGTANFDKTQGVVAELTIADIASGKLANWLNTNDTQDADAFYQTIGTDAYPVPFTTSAKVYGTAWDGTNTVYYNNVENVVNASDVVINDLCDDFNMPAGAVSVTAQKVSYSRANVAGFNTVCLPFALTSTMLPTGAKIYTTGDIGATSVKITEVTEVAAGQPCLVEFPADYTAAWDINIDTPTTFALAPVNGDLKGSYTTTTIGAGKYKLNPEGTEFGITSESASVYPFRAYLEAGSGARGLSIIFGDETGINGVGAAAAAVEVYNAKGQRMQQLEKGVNIVRMANGETRTVIVK